jgi:hypothetical protein
MRPQNVSGMQDIAPTASPHADAPAARRVETLDGEMELVCWAGSQLRQVSQLQLPERIAA